MNRLIGLGAGAVLLAIATACGSSSTSGSPASSPGSPTGSGTPGSTGAAALTLGTSSVGPILLGGQGRTLYLFAADTGPTSTCNGSCASAWPPDTTTGQPQAGTGLHPSLVGTTTRADRTVQVTYGGHPLYYYSGDAKAGDLNGQGSTAFGATWHVLNAAGAPVTGTASPTSPGGNGGGGYGGGY